ncbi:uncharacterized protein LOC125946569 [Dermacentor silvarum]|uniref:uncharacterized protein LOC125946569 n=1 Tax=Dermacentor silvarum TaxID=543639 RepID=UPI0021008DEA|nr:uncharacterized protein LOC125946569 [Dermacentor silvarum]
MTFCKLFNIFVGILVATVTVPMDIVTDAQDCQKSPQDCSATQVLSDFTVFNTYVTSDPNPTKFCERYDQTSLSDDGNTAEYDLVYRDATGSDEPINDTSTFTVANNTAFYVTYGSDDGTVYQLNLDFVNGNQCFVGHCNCTDTHYYLFDSADSDIFEYHKCFNKIVEYSGGNVVFLRDLSKCKQIPPKP